MVEKAAQSDFLCDEEQSNTDEKRKEKTRPEEGSKQAQSAAEMPLLRCPHSGKLDREDRGGHWGDTFLHINMLKFLL